MARQLKLVRKFEHLRQGMTVVDIACDCGRIHDARLAELRECDGLEVAWSTDPQCRPGDPPFFCGIDADAVAAHRIFAVVDGQPMAMWEQLLHSKKERAR